MVYRHHAKAPIGRRYRASLGAYRHNYACTFWSLKMSASALLTIINARNANPATLRAMLCEAFKADALHLVTANNGEPMQSAINALPMGKTQIKGAQNKALGDAIGQGVAALRKALPDGQGWIGAARGSFAKASKADRAPYEQAHALACEAFAECLNASEAWADKPEVTPEEKAQKKAEREAAKAEAEAAIVKAGIDARIASGELVPADKVQSVESLSVLALVEALEKAISRDGITDNARDILMALIEPANA